VCLLGGIWVSVVKTAARTHSGADAARCTIVVWRARIRQTAISLPRPLAFDYLDYAARIAITLCAQLALRCFCGSWTGDPTQPVFLRADGIFKIIKMVKCCVLSRLSHLRCAGALAHQKSNHPRGWRSNAYVAEARSCREKTLHAMIVVEHRHNVCVCLYLSVSLVAERSTVHAAAARLPRTQNRGEGGGGVEFSAVSGRQI
jgi:hypothetical protein